MCVILSFLLLTIALFIPMSMPRIKSKYWRTDSVALSAGKCTQVGMAKVLLQLRHTLLLSATFWSLRNYCALSAISEDSCATDDKLVAHY